MSKRFNHSAWLNLVQRAKASLNRRTLESGNSSIATVVPSIGNKCASVESIFDYLSAAAAAEALDSTISLLPDYIKCGGRKKRPKKQINSQCTTDGGK